MSDRTSAKTPIGRGQVGAFRSDQVVVALSHLPLVMRELERWNAAPRPAVRNQALGLALVGVDAAAAMATMDREVPDWAHEAVSASKDEGYQSSDLDAVVRVMNRSFAAAYAGWVPTMAKNRILERVVPAYVIDGGGAGKPAVPVNSKYVIDGGGAGRPPVPVTNKYVIDGGGSGGPHSIHSKYVIDGGGTDGPRDASGRLQRVPARQGGPGRGVRVGVIDTRLSAHPWLAGGYVSTAGDLRMSHHRSGHAMAAHATFVTGLVLRQAPGAVVEFHRGLLDDGSRDSWSVATAITELAGQGIQVINLSLGCFTDDSRPPLVLAAALAALGPDTVVVAAAGNHGAPNDPADDGGSPKPWWPAAFDTVVAVGAVDGNTAGMPRAPFSPAVPWVDVMAPGVDVVSTFDDLHQGGSGFARWSGTSFSAAVVSGAIAARVVPGQVSAREAWETLQRRAPRDDDGHPVVPLRPVRGWPADGDPGPAGGGAGSGEAPLAAARSGLPEGELV